MTPAEAIRGIRRGPHLPWLVGLTALALALRLGFVLAFEPTSLRVNDSLFYHAVASELADGEGFSLFGQPTAHWPPVVPFLFSLPYRLVGPEPLSAAVLNAVLGAATVPLLYAAALRPLGVVAARFAGLALALMPGQILFADTLTSETTFTFLLVAFVALAGLLPERRWWAPVALGAVAGVAALTRGEGLVLPVIALAAWYPVLARRELLGRLAVLVVTMAVVVAPWMARNASHADSFVGVATNSSTTLWSGHNPDADGAATYAPPSLLRPAAGKSGIAYEVAEARVLRREAFEHMRTRPLRELGLIPLKLVALNQGDSEAIGTWIHDGSRPAVVANAPARLPAGEAVGDQRDLPPAPPVIGRTAARTAGILADVAYYGLLAAMVASLAVFGRGLWRHRVLRGSLAMIGAALFLYGFVYYGNFRYRVPLEPLMILVAAPLAPALLELRRRAA